MTYIATNTGKIVDFSHDMFPTLSIKEIANSLSKLCRYTGHTNKFYSVAEHSVMASYLVPEKYALAALLHDASEVYVGDISAPLKEFLGKEVEDIERKAVIAVAHQFDIDMALFDCNEVHEVDKALLYFETLALMPKCNKHLSKYYNSKYEGKVTIQALPHTKAKKLFLKRFQEIQEKVNV